MSQKNASSSRLVSVMIGVCCFGAICALLVFTCGGTTEASRLEARQKERIESWNRSAASIQYAQDKRTGLCFAFHPSGMTSVPYEKVKHLLENPNDDVNRSDPENE
jgi:hypothetical protein